MSGRLLAWAPASIWLTTTAMAAVLLWGAVDPFKLRQRLDWMWADQLLKSSLRRPPSVDPNLVLIAIDDASTEQLGRADSRHRLARALRELGKLGARTVMLDQILHEEGSPSPFYREEAVSDGIPSFEVPVPNLVMDLYTEDRLLAKSLGSLNAVVLPFTLNLEAAAQNPRDTATIERMAKMLVEQHELTPQDLATELKLELPVVRALYELALKRATALIAANVEETDQILKSAEGQAALSALMVRLRAARDREECRRILQQKSSFDLNTETGLARFGDVQLPRPQFVRGFYPSFPPLGADDILDWPGFCSMLIEESEDDDNTLTPGSRILRLMTPDARKTIADVKRTNQFEDARKLEIIGAMREVLKNPYFLQDSHFEKVVGADEAKLIFVEVQLGQRRLLTEEIEGLNRTLLEAAFPPSVLARGTPRVARVGFADAKLDDEDDGGVFRRLPFVAILNGRGVVHAGLAALAEQWGVNLRDLKLEGRRLRLSSDRTALLDSKGRLIINWPMNQRRNWQTAINPIPLTAFLELARYEDDLNTSQHKLRRIVALLANKTDLSSWFDEYTTIRNLFSEGNFTDAAEHTKKFDAQAIPAVLRHPTVQDAMEQAKKTLASETSPPPGPLDEQPGESLVDQAREALIQLQKIDELRRDQKASADQLRQRVEDKLCLIGDATTGSVDFKQTPVGRIPGVALILSAVNTVMTGKYLTVCGYWVSALAMLLVAGSLATPLVRLKPLAAGACGLAGLLGTSLAGVILLAVADVIFSPITPLIGLVAVYLTTTTFQWVREHRQKTLVRAIFETHTNPTIVDRLIKAGNAGVEEVLKPKNRQLTLFFAEIANFEELANQLSAERLPEVFSRTFDILEKIIKLKDGTVDRYQGHAMVAYFGAPYYLSDHALRACQTALECRDALNSLAESWKSQGLPVPHLQVGLHTGELLVGNINPNTKMDYTVAGDNLNVAYRIGELNETYGTQIMISEATLIRCDKQIEARELDMVRIKGRREPVRAYELMSAKGQLSPNQLQLCGTFTTGLIAFRNRDYASAIAMFRTCKATSPADRATTLYIERCERELAQTQDFSQETSAKTKPMA